MSEQADIAYDQAKAMYNRSLTAISELRERASLIIGANTLTVALVMLVVEDLISRCRAPLSLIERLLTGLCFACLFLGVLLALAVIWPRRQVMLFWPHDLPTLLGLSREQAVEHLVAAAIINMRRMERRWSFLRASLLSSSVGLSLLVLGVLIGLAWCF